MADRRRGRSSPNNSRAWEECVCIITARTVVRERVRDEWYLCMYLLLTRFSLPPIISYDECVFVNEINHRLVVQ
jgi:hypothetical protein